MKGGASPSMSRSWQSSYWSNREGLRCIPSPGLSGCLLHEGQGNATVRVTGQAVVNRLNGNSVWTRVCL